MNACSLVREPALRSIRAALEERHEFGHRLGSVAVAFGGGVEGVERGGGGVRD